MFFCFHLQQFKWTVREARPLWQQGGHHDHVSADVSTTNGYHDVSNDSIDDVMDDGHKEEYYDEDAGCWRTVSVTPPRQRYEDDDANAIHDGRRDDVIRSDEPVEETPIPRTTRNMLAMFQSMEDVNRPPPTPEYAAKQAASRRVATASLRRSAASPPPAHTLHLNNHQQHTSHYNYNGHGNDHDYDEHEAHYNNHHHSNGSSQEDLRYTDYDRDGGEFENEPETGRRDVIREGDPGADPEEELPEQGTTKNLLAKFQALTA